MKILVSEILKAYDSTISYADKVMSSLSEDKIADAVSAYYGTDLDSKVWEDAIKMVMEADDISTEQKAQLIGTISAARDASKEKEISLKHSIADKFCECNERKINLSIQIILGIASGGISLIPMAIKAVNSLSDNSEVEDNEDAA